MAEKKIPTRQLLLETAGELFAEHGFAATSVKMIAERSHQNIAAVNYHFGSKQNLLNEALKFVLQKIMTPVQISGKAARHHAEIETELALFISERTRFLLSPKTPKWYGELIIRAVIDAPDDLKKENIAILSPDFDYLENLARRYVKQLSTDNARRWAYSVVGQIFFYVLGRNMILIANEMPTYSKEYISSVTEQVTETAIQWLKYRKQEESK